MSTLSEQRPPISSSGAAHAKVPATSSSFETYPYMRMQELQQVSRRSDLAHSAHCQMMVSLHCTMRAGCWDAYAWHTGRLLTPEQDMAPTCVRTFAKPTSAIFPVPSLVSSTLCDFRSNSLPQHQDHFRRRTVSAHTAVHCHGFQGTILRQCREISTCQDGWVYGQSFN